MSIADDWVIDYADKKIFHLQSRDNLPGGSDSSVAEITEITVLAASGITTGDYFLLYSATDNTGYYVWYNKDGGGGDPAVADKTGIEAVISTGDANTVVATATRDAINSTAPADFTATASSSIVTVTNDAKGSTTDASDSSGGTATDFTFTVTTQGKGKTVWSVNAFYSFLQDQLDEVNVLKDSIPVSAQTPTDYTLVSGWFIDDESTKYLNGGALKTVGYASGGIRVLTMNAGGYTDPGIADIGTGVTQAVSGHTGKLLFFNSTLRKWWVRPTDSATDTFSTTNTVTVDGASTGEGTPSGSAVSGEDLYANVYTLGALETAPKPVTYIFQGGSYIPGWWSRGDTEAHIDILVKVKEAGTLISDGIITLYVRQFGDLYDNFTINLSAGGRNAVPLSTQRDTANNALGETYLLYDSETANFTAGKIVTGATSGATAEIIALQDDGTTGYLTLGNVVGTFQNNETITDDNVPAGSALANGTLGDTVLSYDAETVGFTTLGQIITGATSQAKRALRGVQDNGTAGRLNLQVSAVTNPDHFIVYSDNELISGSTEGSADANGASTTAASGFANVKVWFMNVEVDFASLNGLINEGEPVTGATSGATAIFLAEKDSNTLQLSNWNGTSFTVGEQLQKDGSNYYVLAGTLNQTTNHLINKAFQLQSSNPYSVIADCAGRRVAQAYEWLKYITREKANVSQINRQIMYPLIGGVVDEQDGEEYIGARVSPDTAYVQSKASPLGTFSGGKLFGAQGVWIQDMHSDDIQAFQVIDANGTIQNPPNFQTIKVSGVVSGDRVTVFRTTGGTAVNKAVFTSASGNNITDTTFVVNEAIPADTPASGIIRIVDISDTTNTRERRYSYTSWVTSTFNGITKTFGDLSAGLDRNYTLTDDTAYVPYIDIQAASTEVSQTIIYVTNRTVVTWVRKYAGTSTIIPFQTSGTLTSSGFSVTAIRTIDPIAT